jgi:hypothetical protein
MVLVLTGGYDGVIGLLSPVWLLHDDGLASPPISVPLPAYFHYWMKIGPIPSTVICDILCHPVMK